jgi:hypothetical protein
MVRDFVIPTSAALRQANPLIEVAVQLRAEGDPAALGALVDSLAGHVDGVAILAGPQTAEAATELWTQLRAQEADPPSTQRAHVEPRIGWIDGGRAFLSGLAVQAAVLVGLGLALLLILRLWPSGAATSPR